VAIRIFPPFLTPSSIALVASIDASGHSSPPATVIAATCPCIVDKSFVEDWIAKLSLNVAS